MRTRRKEQHASNRKSVRRIAAIACFAVAAISLLYLFLGRVLEERNRSTVYTRHMDAVEEATPEQLQEAWDAAVRYNTALSEGVQHITVYGEDEPDSAVQYEELLNLTGDGVMGYVEIPELHTVLPIGHGTGPEVLECGVGHLIGTSLPVGGENTHAALSGHSGMARSKLFSDLGRLKRGDRFFLHVLDRTLTYQVDRITVVEPGDTSKLTIEPGRDLVTLITCTPYGINTHRLMVRGIRVETVAAKLLPAAQEAAGESNNAVPAWHTALPMVLVGVLLLCLSILIRRRRR